MPFNTYDTLRATCLKILDRETDPTAPDMFDIALRECEDQIFLRLRSGWNVRSAQFVWDSSSGLFEYLPDSYSGMMALLDAANGEPVDPIGPNDMKTWLDRAGGGKFAHIITGYLLQIVPTPENGHPFFLYYYSRQEFLSSDNQSNGIIEKLPALYLNGTMAYLSRKYGENASEYGASFEDFIETANATAPDWIRNVGAAMTTPGGP